MARHRSLRALAVLARRVAELLEDPPEGGDADRVRDVAPAGESTDVPRRLLEPGMLSSEKDGGPPAAWVERVRRGAPWRREELSRGRARPAAGAPEDVAMEPSWPALATGEPRWPGRRAARVRTEPADARVHDFHPRL